MPAQDFLREFDNLKRLKREINEFDDAAKTTTNTVWNQSDSGDASQSLKSRFDKTVIDGLTLLNELLTAWGGINRRNSFGKYLIAAHGDVENRTELNSTWEEHREKLLSILHSLGKLPVAHAFNEKYGLDIQALQGNKTAFDFDINLAVIGQYHGNQFSKRIQKECAAGLFTDQSVLRNLNSEGFKHLENLQNFEDDIDKGYKQRFLKDPKKKQEYETLKEHTASLRTELEGSMERLKKFNPNIFFETQRRFDIRAFPNPKTNFDIALKKFSIREYNIQRQAEEIDALVEKSKEGTQKIQAEVTSQYQRALKIIEDLKKANDDINFYKVRTFKYREIKDFKFDNSERKTLHEMAKDLESQLSISMGRLQSLAPYNQPSHLSELDSGFSNLAIESSSSGQQEIPEMSGALGGKGKEPEQARTSLERYRSKSSDHSEGKEVKEGTSRVRFAV
jgi:hypothetical protein